MKTFLLISLTSLVVMYALFRYPEKMLSPGKLSSGHESISNDCFACHTMTKGTSDEKCLSCHKLTDIGLLTTEGVSIDTSKKSSPTFHQYLTDKTCVRCHTEHEGPTGKGPLKSFEHVALKEFSEKECVSCHKKPCDLLHKNVSQSCRQCHNINKWVPASFDHDDYFRLDKDHQTDCEICHQGNSYSEYTCYGCHEHTPSKMRKKHEKEGMRDFNNCVECHRSADEHEAEKKWNSMRSGNGRDGEHDKRDIKKKHKKRHKDDDDHHDDHDDDDD